MSEKEKEPGEYLKNKVSLLGYWSSASNSLLTTDTIRSDDGLFRIFCDFTLSEFIPIFDISFPRTYNTYYRFCLRVVFCLFQYLMYKENTQSEQRDVDDFDDALSGSTEQVNDGDSRGIGSVQAYNATPGRCSRRFCSQPVAAIRNRKKRKVKGRTRSKIPRVLASMVFVLCVPCIGSSSEYPVRSFSTLSTYKCNRVTFRYNRTCPVPSLFDSLIDHCHFQCDKGMQPNCIPMEPGSMYICLKAGEKVPSGYMWEAILDDNELSRLYIIQKECPPNFFQSEPSKPTDSVKACKHEHANLDNLAVEFEVSKMGNISSPTTVHCNFNEGFFNQDNKSEFNYDLDVTGSLVSAFCIHTSFYNPCSKGEMVLHNGTCVESCADGFYRDYHSNFACKIRDDLSRPVSVQQLSVSSFSSVTTIKSTTSETWPSTKQSGEKNSENSTDAHVKIVACLVAIVILILLILLGSIACLCYCRNKEAKKNRREDDAEAFKDGADGNEEDVCENEVNVNGKSTEDVDERGKQESKRRKKKQVIRKRTGNEASSRINNGNIQQNQNCSVHNYYHLCPSKEDNLLNPSDEIEMTRLKTIHFEEQYLDDTTHKTMRKSCGFPASRANIVSECPMDVSLVDISSGQSPLDGGHRQQVSEVNSEIDDNRKCKGRVLQVEDKRSINDTVEVREQDQFNFDDAEDSQTVSDSDGNHEYESEDDYPISISTTTEMNTTFCEDDRHDKGDMKRSDAKFDQRGRYLTAQGSLASNNASSDEADERSSLLEVAELREN